jgi:signal transduction histidine kinase
VTGGDGGPVFQRVDLPHESMLAIVVVRRVNAGARPVRLVAGRLIDQRFLVSFTLPDGVRAMLYRNFDPELGSNRLISTSGVISLSTSLEPLVSEVRRSGRETLATVASPELETVDAIPLFGADHAVLGVLLVAASNREAAALLGRMHVSGIAFGAAGVLLGLLSSYLLARRVTRPVESLAVAAQEIAAGRWDVRTDDVRASGEIGALARAFDMMSRELSHQRERLIQAERVAAWRELARRLAHELKNPLFPLRLTIDNLRKAKSLPPAEFNEVFDESLATMSDGLANLNTIVGRFSDFARMPSPELGPVSPNVVIERVVRLFQLQMETTSPSPIRVSLDLDSASPVIRADEEQLARVMQNLVLNAIDAMPDGGTLTIRTRLNGATFAIDVCDTGGGLTNEERQRLFTPYYTTKQHGTGLGLAIVQSVVSDHCGKVWVDSAPGRGTTIHLAFQG